MEYGTVGWTKGQVLGGRWKPLHYEMKRSLYTNQLVTCGSDLNHGGGGKSSKAHVCYALNDGIDAFEGQVVISALPLVQSAAAVTAAAAATATATAVAPAPQVLNLTMAAGPGIRQWFTVSDSMWELGLAGTHVLVVDVTDAASNTVVHNHVILLTTPKKLSLAKATVKYTLGGALNQDGSVPIAVTSDEVALFVTFTTLAQGRFTDNSFHVTPSKPVQIDFVPFANFSRAELQSTLRVEHLQQNL